jgi:Ni,Fe-hydrogenase III small subunit
MPNVGDPLPFSCPTCGRAFLARLDWKYDMPQTEMVKPVEPEVPGEAPSAEAVIDKLVNVLEIYAHQHSRNKRVSGCPVCDMLVKLGK